jgi:hypothetical protein
VVVGRDRKRYVYPLSGENRRRSLASREDARLPALWPPGPYALASAAAKVVEAIVGRSRHRAVCFVAPDDAAGVSEINPYPTPSGEAYAYNYTRTLSDLYLVDGVR